MRTLKYLGINLIAFAIGGLLAVVYLVGTGDIQL